jgi:acetyl esterase/lipase/lysophospholipase L1-like esterase
MRRPLRRAAAFAAFAFLATHSTTSSAAEGVQIDRAVVYGEANGEKLLADVYRPAGEPGDAKHAAVLLIHGGGWRGGDRFAGSMVALANALAEKGFVAMSIDYRLVKSDDGKTWQNSYPVPIDDCRTAVRWLRTHADDYGVDATKLGAAGDSAGGHLVSMLGTSDVPIDGVSSRVQAVVDIFGPVDLTQDFSKMEIGVVNVQQLLDSFVATPEYKREASPLMHIDDQSAAFLIFHGTKDPLVPVQQSRDFHEALKKAGRTSGYVEFEGAGHGFGGAQWNELVAKSLAFFDVQLRGTAASSSEESASTEEKPAQPAPDLGALFKMHYANRVRAFGEQNLEFQHVVLLGDSITEGFDVTKHFPGRRVLNRGIGADVIGNALPEDDPRGVLRRLDESVFNCAATDVFLMIGINDLGSGRTPDVMEQGYRELLEKIHSQAPAVRVHVQSVLPTRDRFAKHNEPVKDFNSRLRKLAGEFGYDYLDLHALMVDDHGELKAEYTADGLHLRPEAYDVWRAEVERLLGW